MSSIQSLEPASHIHINMSVGKKNNRGSDKLLFLVFEMNFKRLKMANAGEHDFEAAQLSASLPVNNALAAEAGRALEGRSCFHPDQQALRPGDRSAAAPYPPPQGFYLELFVA